MLMLFLEFRSPGAVIRGLAGFATAIYARLGQSNASTCPCRTHFLAQSL